MTKKTTITEIGERTDLQTDLYVTEMELSAINSNNIYANIFLFVSSLMGGAYFSIFVSKLIGVTLTKESLGLSSNLMGIFMWVGIVSFAMTIYFYIQSYKATKNIIRTEGKSVS